MCSNAVKNYNLINKIGAGGLCTIWEVRHRSSGDIYAFKQLHEKSINSYAAIHREFEFLAFHKYPGLIGVYDFISAPGYFGFVMDYLNGPTLESMCGKLDDQKILTVIAEILGIANFVYHCGYIFNDYKPQNFMYNSKRELKLIDFNLMSPVGGDAPKTCGTLGYLAPELLTGKAPSLLTDIYSLGATFYELASGRMPFSVPDEGALIKLITETVPPSPGTSNGLFNDCILKMLSPDPSQRPQTFLEIARTLGIETELKVIIKNTSGFYLDSGANPYAHDMIDSIRERQSSARLFGILAGDRYEHEHLIRDAKILLNLPGVVGTPALPEATGTGFAGLEKYAGNLPAGDIERVNGVYIADCKDNFSQDLYNIAKAIDTDIVPGNILFFTTDRSILKFRDNFKVMSLPDKPDRTASYINHLLKKYEAPDDFIQRMQALAGGDAEVIYHYIKHYIANDAIEYADSGWVFNNIDYSLVPLSLTELMEAQAAKLCDDQKVMVRWLALMNDFCTASSLAKLTGFEKAAIDRNLDVLLKLGWIGLEGELIAIAGAGKAGAVYNNITENEKIEMHRLAAFYLKANYPEEIEAIFRHLSEARFYREALQFGYRAAMKWYEKFDFKKAGEFIGAAENIIPRIAQSGLGAASVIKTLLLSGDIAKAVADNQNAENKYLQAADLAVGFQLNDMLAIAFKNLGDIYRHQQNTPKSIEYSLKALEIYEQLCDLSSQAACFNNLGLAYWISGDYPQALTNFEKSLKLNREQDNLTEQSKIHNNIGIIYDITGRTLEVLPRFEEALRCAVEVKNLKLEAKYLNNIGFFYLNSGKPRKALDYFMKCYDLAGSTGNSEEQLNTIYNISLAYHKMGEFLKSAEANQRAFDIAISLNHKFFAAQSAHLLARDCLALGNFKLCRIMLEKAEAMCSNLSNAELLTDILQARIEYELCLGDIDKAIKYREHLNKQPAPTQAQKAKTTLLGLKLKAMQRQNISDAELNEFINECRQSNHMETAGLAILEKIRLFIDSDRLENVESALADYHSLGIDYILINFDSNLLTAEYLLKARKYNEALEIISDIRNAAGDRNCLPILFKAWTIEALTLYECGKQTQAAKALKNASTLYNVLADAWPEDKDQEGFNGLHHVIIYRHLDKVLLAKAEIDA